MTTTVLENSVEHKAQTLSHEVGVAPSPDASFERYDTIDTPKIVIVGFVSAILTFVVIVAAQAAFFMAANQENVRKSIAVTDTTVEQVVTQQRGRLADYAWVDAEAGVVSIPIDMAMSKVVAEEKGKQNESVVTD